jgi:hypothetical protein
MASVVEANTRGIAIATKARFPWRRSLMGASAG